MPRNPSPPNGPSPTSDAESLDEQDGIRAMLSQSVEDYLKAIYHLQGDSTVSTSDLARQMGITAASVTNMAKRLAGMGLVRRESYRGIRLTEPGKKVALEIIRHHRLLETYLREVMGYGWEQMHDEAERLEHHISEEFEERLDEMLGFPTHDPHGDPIPTRDLDMPVFEAELLVKCSPDVDLTVRRLVDTDPVILTFLESVGLLPGARLRIVEPIRKGKPVAVDTADGAHRLEYSVASHVYASPETA